MLGLIDTHAHLTDEKYNGKLDQMIELFKAENIESVFTVKEKLEFFKKKWLREHFAFLCFLGVTIIGIFVLGFIIEQYVLIAISSVVFVVCHAWRNNAMMSYAEGKVFDETRVILKDNVE